MTDTEDLLTQLIDNDRTKAKASRADNDSEQAESVRRLLLYEVLLEEYESHSPASLDAATQSLPLDPSIQQPPLDVREVARIKEDGRKLRRYCEGITDKKQREDFETRFNGQLVSRVCDLMYRAQKTTADREVARLRDHYKKQYGAAGRTADLQRLVTEAVIDHITEEAQATHAAFGRGANGDGKPSTATPSTGDANQSAGASVADDDDNFIEGIVAENDSTRTTGDKAKRIPEQLYGCTLRSALCLSGGGIRSATFNLGILQGLARHGLLEKFDYLSTVSGGGFIGSWLTAWMHRQGTQRVV
ncbi:MAG: patatin-like phospholipase family protein, partial [Acidobacteriota bacterium]|nr:patatin-like phospholipase family protein [Acidobacteriota bacterium]